MEIIFWTVLSVAGYAGSGLLTYLLLTRKPGVEVPEDAKQLIRGFVVALWPLILVLMAFVSLRRLIASIAYGD